MVMSFDSFDDQYIIPGLEMQAGIEPSVPSTTYFDTPDIDLNSYDNIIVCMSGGKDSIACLLHIIEMGADKSKIELWHHEVDGRKGSSPMDWK